MIPKTSPNSSFTCGGTTPAGSATRSTLRRSPSQIGRISSNSSRTLTMMMDTPVFEVEVIESIWGSSWIAFSMGSVTSCSTRSGLAPGKRVITWAERTVNPGSSARAMVR